MVYKKLNIIGSTSKTDKYTHTIYGNGEIHELYISDENWMSFIS